MTRPSQSDADLQQLVDAASQAQHTIEQARLAAETALAQGLAAEAELARRERARAGQAYLDALPVFLKYIATAHTARGCSDDHPYNAYDNCLRCIVIDALARREWDDAVSLHWNVQVRRVDAR